MGSSYAAVNSLYRRACRSKRRIITVSKMYGLPRLLNPTTHSSSECLTISRRVSPSAIPRGDAGFIMQSLSEALDAFIGNYLRVNTEACG